MIIFFLSSLFSIVVSAQDLDLDALVANADHKPLFLFFHKPHCGHCSHMIASTLNDPEIAQEIKQKFVYVDIYTADEGELSFNGFRGTRRAFAQSLGYDFYPTSVFVEAPSKKIINITPGARKKEFFIKLLDYVSTRQYQKMEFETYLDTLDLDSDD